MYQEPWGPPAGESLAEPPPPPRGRPLPAYAPPAPAPYVYEPPPPAPLRHRSPWNSLWVGVRVGAIFPFGNAYDYSYSPYYNNGESWSGLASGGLAFEPNIGARFARHFVVYGFWEHGWLSTGSDPSWRTGTHSLAYPAFGDQSSATTDYPGLGFRWSARPDAAGVVVDLGVGYRWFREKWSSGTELTMGGFGEFRAGIGADIRVNRGFSLSPMLMFSSGSFSEREISLPGQPKSPIPSLGGSHGAINLTLGGYFDVGGT